MKIGKVFINIMASSSKGRILLAIMGTFLVSSCNPMGGEKAKVTFFNPSAFKDLKVSVGSVSLVNHQLIINGSGLSKITTATLKKDNQSEVFQVESASDTQLIASGLKNISLLAGSVFDLILADAYGSATFQVSITLADGSVTASKLNSMGALAGQVLKYNGSAWVPTSLVESQLFLGTWNASTNVPDLSNPSSTAGDYYVVSTGGVFNGVTYASGDWIISDGYSWSKIPYSKTSVSSFQGRKGVVTLVPGDYVSLKDTGTQKITGSSINDLADIDFTTAPLNGQVLKYNSATSKWAPANDNSAAAGIALTDLSATSPLSYNSTTGVFSLPTANVLALPLTGLSSGTGAISASDSLLGAIGKLMSVPSDYVSRSTGASIVSGTIAVSGTGMITVPTATGTTLTEVANVTYVNNAISSNGVWNKSGSDINYAAGSVGIGTSTPSGALHINNNNVSDSADDFWLTTYSNTATPGIFVTRARGDQTTPTSILSGDTLFTLSVGGHNGSVNRNAASIKVLATNNFSTSPMADLTFSTNGGATAATERMRITSGGNVGIGTTTPENANTWDRVLDTYGASHSKITATSSTVNMSINAHNSGFYGAPAGGLLGTKTNHPVSLYTNSISRMTVDSSGNVGIGTTTPVALFDVNGNSSSYKQAVLRNTNGQQLWLGAVANTVGTYIGGNAYYNSSYQFIPNYTAASGINFRQDGSTEFWNDTGLTSGTSYLPTKRMVILSSGNVGIGTTSPSTPLHVVAPGTIGLDTVMKLGVADSSDYLLLQNNTSTATNFDPTFFGVTPRAGGYPLSFVGAVTSGNDTGSVPLVNFQARVGTESSGTMVVNRDLFDFSNFGTSVMRISASGKIGIGTTGPTSQIHLFKNTVGPLASSIEHTAGTAAQYILGSNGSYIGYPNTQFLSIGTTASNMGAITPKLTLDSSGNVGIGTNAPTAALTIGSNPVAILNANELLQIAHTGDAYMTVADGTAKALFGTTAGLPFLGTQTATDFVFRTNNVERVRILSGGNVGIGATSPAAKLQVGTPVSFTPASSLFGVYGTDDTGATPIAQFLSYRTASGPTHNKAVEISQTASFGGGILDIFGSSTGKIHFDPNGTSYVLPQNSGNFGIGTNAPSTLLHVNTATAGATVATFQSGTGSCTVIPNTGMSCSSDKRLKENIEEIMNGLDRVLNLRGVTFKWIDRKEGDETRHMGFIAQEVEKVAPELVKIDSRGYKQVNYANFVAVLTSAIKEFFQRWSDDSRDIHREIASVKEQNAQLKADNQEMKKALCELGKKTFCASH